jgi:hypothetical protein
MKRASETGGGGPPQKRQATMAAFFSSPSLEGVPKFAVSHHVLCPYCTKKIAGTERSLAGGLKTHVMVTHPFEFMEASMRAERATSLITRSIFDLEPMSSIPEGTEPSDISQIGGDPAAPTPNSISSPNPKTLRHSYSIKDKFMVLK